MRPILRIKKRVPIDPKLSPQEFNKIKNNILIIRELGGLGDILMHRMIFEDFKKLMPESKLIFACPPWYHEAVDDHPYIDEIVDCRTIDCSKYIISYDTTDVCGKYESRIAPFSDKHRSDIWAEHCGVKLNNHNMHIKINDEIKEKSKKLLLNYNNKRKVSVALCPISAMIIKNLMQEQIRYVVNNLRERDVFVYSVHKTPISILEEMNVPVFTGLSIKEWMGMLDAADYVISVDSAAFHFAGGTEKPVMGIFTFVDGKVYSKYYKNSITVQKHRDDGWDCGPCYIWGNCPKTEHIFKPCLTEISEKMLDDGINKLFKLRKHGTDITTI